MVEQPFNLQPNEARRLVLSCPAANQAALSGGWSQGDDNIAFVSSFPVFNNPTGTGSWVFDMLNKKPALVGRSLYIICEYREHH